MLLLWIYLSLETNRMSVDLGVSFEDNLCLYPLKETWSYVTHGLCVSGLHGVSRQEY